MIKDQRSENQPAAESQAPGPKVRRDIATDAAAHALRLLEKVRAATEAQVHKRAAAKQSEAIAPHAIVIGGGVAGLVAARDLRQTGYRVTVLEAADSFGGCVRRTEVDGLLLDAGAESFAVRGGSVANYLDELDLGEAIVQTSGERAWLIHAENDKLLANPLPATALLGIPGTVRTDEVRNIIGRAATVRAAADLITPMSRKWATEKLSLAEVVRSRMGQAVLDELVAPVVNGVYSTDPAQIDIDAAAPGLREAMQKTGSLARAVTALQDSAPAGSRVAGLDGGMYTLIEALTGRLSKAGVLLVRNSPVTSITRDKAAAQPFTVHTLGQELKADRVVIATEAQPALALLNPLLGEVKQIAAENQSNAIALAILVVDKPELDDAPRGSGVLVARNAPVHAKALTHSSAKWPWLGEQSGPGTHVVRLSYGRIGEADELVAGGDDAALIEEAIKDASKILGVQLQPEDVLGSAVSRFSDMVPLQGTAAVERRSQVRAATAEIHGLDVVGAWLAGTGLARVINHARGAVAISAS
ncbi:protoporphyrinogen oxidase [Glutamicibacter sp.]|uniref:protoporphyrinogen oxidase n=1 Tax=Glutamicibacter sp. TaxID=1931995 RepID=UPI0028BD8CE5|nr:protoporphyrinogen oxidase [Glutamicibacter sp.]